MLRYRFAGKGLVVSACVILWACDIPTALPIVEPRFVIDLERAEVAVAQLLPGSVTVQGNAFAVALQPVLVQQTLSQLCGSPCSSAQGQVPKPAFVGTVSAPLLLPANVNSATVESGSVLVALTNNLSFDPIRPSASARGFIITVLSSGATVLARDSIAGSTTPFAPGSTITRTLTIPAATAASQLTVSATVSSPAGDPVSINPNSAIVLLATPQNVRAGSANVIVANQAISVSAVELDLADVDRTIEEHTKTGALQLVITNPFNVTGPMTMTFVGSGLNVAPKTFALSGSSATVAIPLTKAELQSLLGATSTLTISGVVNGGAGGVTVAPDQVLSLSIRLDLTMTTEDTNG